MGLERLLTVVAAAGGLWWVAEKGTLGKDAAAVAGDVRTALAPTLAALGLHPVGANGLPCPTAGELAKKLGTTTWRVQQAMAKSGKDGCALGLADLAGIPEVPDTVLVGGVPSHPNPQGPPASFDNPTGGSTSWGGLSAEQIRAAYISAAGGNVDQARAQWDADHKTEQLQRGF